MESYSFGRYGYREIDSQESLDTLFEKYEWFHDTVIKEIHINNLIYMSDTAIACVADDHNYSARVLIQGDFTEGLSAIELLCVGINQFVLFDNLFVLDTAGQVDLDNDGKITSIRLVFDDAHIIQCQQLWVRPVPDGLGNAPRFGDFNGLKVLTRPHLIFTPSQDDLPSDGEAG